MAQKLKQNNTATNCNYDFPPKKRLHETGSLKEILRDNQHSSQMQ